jgi:hypothetical protein
MFMVNPETFFATKRGHGLVTAGFAADDRIRGGRLRLHARDQPTKKRGENGRVQSLTEWR